jgi:DUF971 family protein
VETSAAPTRLKLKRDRGLEIEWPDGSHFELSLATLRSMCPCAQCRETRAGAKTAKPATRLTVLPGNYSGALTALGAEPVGNYAIRIDWSDGHGSGIYSFQYLRELCEGKTGE